MLQSYYMYEHRYKFSPRAELIPPSNYFKTYLEELAESKGESGKKPQPTLLNTSVYEEMEKQDINATTYMISYNRKKSKMQYYPNEVPEGGISIQSYPPRYPKDNWWRVPHGVCPKFYM